MAPSVFPSLKKVLLSMCVLLAGSLIGQAQNDVLTWHNNVARTGQNVSEAILTPALVNSTIRPVISLLEIPRREMIKGRASIGGEHNPRSQLETNWGVKYPNFWARSAWLTPRFSLFFLR